MIQIDPLLLLVACLAAILIGFALAAAFFLSVKKSDSNKAKLPLTDVAIAHVAYEARRAYENSLGIIRGKSWNNLTPGQRNSKRIHIRLIQQGDAKPDPFQRAILGMSR